MRLAAVTLLLAVAGLAAWWWWPAATPVPVVLAPGAATEAQTAAVATPAPAGVERTPVSPGPASANGPPIPADVVWVEVRVVDVTTKAPVPHAEVWWKDASCDERVEALPAAERQPFYDDPEHTCRAFGWHARADERGTVRVHADERGTVVIARTEGRWGDVEVARDDAARGVELGLQRDLEVTVLVVDGGGQPVPEVPVDLDHWSGMQTDAAGLVVFQHLQRLVTEDNEGASIPRDEGVFVAIPGLQRQRVSFPLLLPPKEPLTLVLPATGELHVHVLHPGREVESVAAEIWIPAAEDEEEEVQWSRRAGANGVARFHRVPLAQTYEVQASIGDFRMRRTLEGPVSPGQVVHATFELPSDAVALTGRFLTVGGQPAASADLAIDMSPSRSSCHFLTTDEHGRFLWHVDGSNEGRAIRALEEFCVTWRRGPFDTRHGSVASRELQPGVNDLGDIRLDHAPLVVAGRFTFDRTADRDDVEFCIDRWHAGDGAAQPGYWWAVDDLDVHHDRDGRFVVRGEPPPGRLRVNCGTHAAPVEFERGATDLVIEFVRGHAVTVRPRVSNGVPCGDWFAITVTREGDPASARCLPAGEGAADFRPLTAGTYVVDARLAGLPDVLATERVVLPGPDGEFERTIEVDLRKRVEVLRLWFTEGGEVAGGHRLVFVDQHVDAGLREGELDDGGECVLLIPPRAVDVTVLGPYHEAVCLLGVRGDVDVALTPRPKKQVTVRGLPRLGEGQEVLLQIEGDPDGERGPSVELSRMGRRLGSRTLASLLGGGGPISASVGEEALELLPANRDRAVSAIFSGREHRCLLPSLTPPSIPAGTAPLTITFDAAEIRAALEADERASRQK